MLHAPTFFHVMLRLPLVAAGVLALALPATAQGLPQRLAPPGLEAFSQFGVALDAGADVLAVGATGTTAPGDTQGAVFVYASAPGGWMLAGRLVAPGVVGTGFVGASVDVSPDGQWLIAGAPLDETQGIGTGAAFVWRRDAGGAWAFDAKLTASDAEAFDEFGQDVAISDDGEALVGAPFEGDGPTGGGNGAAYVFARGADGAWTQTAKLQPADLPAGATFGRAVALDQGTAVVGAPVPGPLGQPQPPTDPGYVYVFLRDAAGTWSETQRLTGSDSENGDFFGGAVDLRGSFLAVGANQDQDAGPVTGAVYVFQSGSPNGWTQTSKLVPADAEAQDGIGFAVAIVVDSLRPRVVFSALGDDDAGENAGAVYVYDLGGGAWEPQDKLLGTGLDDRFGWSVAATAADVAVGAYTDSAAGFGSGAAYVYTVDVTVGTEAPPAAGALRVGHPQPHPARAGATLAVEADAPGAVAVEVVDALGRTVAHLGTVAASPGRPAAVALPALAPGVYVVVARQDGATTTRVVVVGP